ncbi:phospho-sugar mutase [Cerasibacillus terrae]|uniref:Phosphoglucomutase n=1 Tax=Cerasibacillus terrae TaxID=2498845 RepID=A0A5C8NZW1_9BACI|nr:phospho-sugar mutase [Cerasibacillus terrae]TXL66582.1 phospho-sugar mutase [Cerasibacillus terrae]
MNIWKKAYEKWIGNEQLHPPLKKELQSIQYNEEKLQELFHKDLTFGTGGIRGVVGAGTNRLNIYTIRKVIHGLAHYLLANCVNVKDRGVVIAYDNRYMSKEFAIETAKTLGVFGIKTYVFTSIRPTPLLSYAVRYFGTVAGVMITASHNPPEYNGLKVYNEDGGQLIPEEANEVMQEIQKLDNELKVPILSEIELEEKELLIWVENEVDDAYLQEFVQITRQPNDVFQTKRDLKIVFTPLHGTAYDLVRRGLDVFHFPEVHVVEEQIISDPEFKTVESPNPEEHQAFQLAMEKGYKVDADILLATDPDADRLGVAVKNKAGTYTVLTGNQLGCLFIDYILTHTDPIFLKNGRILKTIVTTELATSVAESYGVEVVNTLTGFKYIADEIRQYDETGETYLFGFEESYGYLFSGFVRDKDAIQAAVMACEMAEFWKRQGKTLLDVLEDLYEKHRFHVEDMTSITLEGVSGTKQIEAIMNDVRDNPFTEIASLQVEKIEDYLVGERKILPEERQETLDLPKENTIKYILENNNWLCLRPSGTEPKIKCYYGVSGKSKEESKIRLTSLKGAIEQRFDQILKNIK